MESQINPGEISTRHSAGIFVLSLATLLLELSLTRVLSVALWYHFGFLVISTALLGFGVSGVTLALSPWLRERAPLDRALALLSLSFGGLTLVCFWLMQHIPFDPFSLASDHWQWIYIPLYYVVLALPFFCSGLGLGLLFTRGAQRIHRLYAYDLVGAGIGCGALALIMPRLGGSGSVVIAAALGIFGAAMFGASKARQLATFSLVACLATVVLAFYADRFLPITVTSLKVTPPIKPIYTAWNTFSRIDVYERKAHPEENTPAMRRFVFDAGTAATGIQDLRPSVRDYLNKNKNDWDYSSGIAYLGKQQPRILIIGSGAGSQVLDALHFGASSITAVEVNPIITDTVARRMNDFWGGLFNQPEVHLVTAEGRNFVRSSRERYDAIISVHTISNAAVASGALALSENYVLTREAFEDYLDHLSPDGVIYFTRPEPQIPRLFATAREALARRGIQDFPARFYAYRIPPDDWEKRMFGADRPSFEAGFLVKKSAFTQDDISRINNLLGVGQPPRDASVPAPEVMYSPFAPGTGIYQTLLTTNDLAHVYHSGPRELEPATDDRPFFNHHTRWSAISSAMLHEVFTEKRLRQLLLGDLPLAELSLLALLAQGVVIATLLILFPLTRWSRSGLSLPSRWRFLVYFGALGFGFITIEMALLSQFSLFLGQPVYTYAVVLASLLIFTGIGANVSGRFISDPRVAVKRTIPILLLVLAVSAVIIPLVFSFALGLSLPLRVLLSMVVLAPLAICLGMPFPLGLRIVSSEAEVLVPWAWGVNGFFTVIGTVMALILAMSFGFRMVLVLGGAAYLLAWAAISQPRKAASVQLLDTGAAIASVLIAAILCGALTPLAEASSSKSLPACCRRDGKHHCARRLPGRADDQSAVFRSKSDPCPYRAANVAPPEVTVSLPGALPFVAAFPEGHLLQPTQVRSDSNLHLNNRSERAPPTLP